MGQSNQHDRFRPLYRRISDAIRRAISDNAWQTLPSLRALSAMYGASVPTVQRALRLLVEEGLLEADRGRRYRTPTASGPQADIPRQPDSAATLAHAVSRAIEQGRFSAGTPLPKRMWFCAEYGVSLPTVGKALRRLCRQGVLHRAGRSWIVGKPREQSASRHRGRDRRPLILVIMRYVHTWRELLFDERVHRFAQTFEQESVRFGVELTPVVDQRDMILGGESLTFGVGDMLSRLYAVRDRYRGALLLGSLVEMPTLGEYAKALAPADMPIVWFDRHGIDAPRSLVDRGVIHCHFSEPAGVDTACAALHKAGHTRVCYVDPYRDHTWARARWEHCRERVVTSAPGMSLTYANGQSTDAFARKELRDALRRLIDGGLPLADSPQLRRQAHGTADPGRIDSAALVEALAGHAENVAWGFTGSGMQAFGLHTQIALITPAMLEAIRTPGVTALIAPNDYIARRMFQWLRLQHIDIPSRMALISFDNSRLVHPLPITSVDFGFGDLGYAAFHALMGDIPVGIGRGRRRPARAFVVHRGSL